MAAAAIGACSDPAPPTDQDPGEGPASGGAVAPDLSDINQPQGDGPDAGPDTCTLPRVERRLLFQHAQLVWRGLSDVIEAAEEGDVPLAASMELLLGPVSWTAVGPRDTCTAAMPAQPVACRPVQNQEGMDQCELAECTGEGELERRLYFAESSRTDLADRHPLSYPVRATGPDGLSAPATVTYDPNPVVVFRYDVSMPGELLASAIYTTAVSLTFDDGPSVDFSHMGSFTLRVRDGEPTDAGIELRFDGLHPEGGSVVLVIERNGAETTGELRHGARVFAVFEQRGFRGLEDCALP